MDRRFSLVMPLRFDRAEVHLGNFSYQGVARLKPGVTLAQANADVTRMLPIANEKFPPPPASAPRCSKTRASQRTCATEGRSGGRYR
jgi:hypothetical protein